VRLAGGGVGQVDRVQVTARNDNANTDQADRELVQTGGPGEASRSYLSGLHDADHVRKPQGLAVRAVRAHGHLTVRTHDQVEQLEASAAIAGGLVMTFDQAEAARYARRMELAAARDEYWPASGFKPLTAKRLWKAGKAGRIRWKEKEGNRKKKRHLYAVRDVRTEWPYLWD